MVLREMVLRKAVPRHDRVELAYFPQKGFLDRWFSPRCSYAAGVLKSENPGQFIQAEVPPKYRGDETKVIH